MVTGERVSGFRRKKINGFRRKKLMVSGAKNQWFSRKNYRLPEKKVYNLERQ